LRNRNLFWQTTFSHEFSNRWTMTGGAGFGSRMTDIYLHSSDEEFTMVGQQQEVIEENQLSQARVNFNHRHKGETLDLGAEVQSRRDVIAAEGDGGLLQDTYGAAYAERAGQLFGRLQGRAGLRLEHSTLLDQTNVAPRMSLNYLINSKEQLFASWGTYHQRPATNRLYQTGGLLDFERAEHYTIGYNRNGNKRSFRAEIYRKEYDQLVRFDPGQQTVDYANTGNGHARGVDLFYRDRSLGRGTDLWFTYSFVDAERRYAHYPVAAQPSFVARHVGNVVLKHFFQKQLLNVGATYTLASGRPYYNPNRPEEEFNTDRTRPYHNLNVNVAYLPKTKKAFSVIVLTLYNAFNFDQTLGYEYSSTNLNVRRGIGPLTKRYLFLGYFVNFGIDRTDNIINQQLN
ncbi:MAG: TonB-dependent receptor, partial [Bacteroidota bacterium]